MSPAENNNLVKGVISIQCTRDGYIHYRSKVFQLLFKVYDISLQYLSVSEINKNTTDFENKQNMVSSFKKISSLTHLLQ